MQLDEVSALKNQLTTARNEINKLRQQVRNLQHVQRKDVESITAVLRDFRCPGCKSTEQGKDHMSNGAQSKSELSKNSSVETNNIFRAIGVIQTSFPEKRAVPRQSSVGHRLRGIVKLNDDIFTNPEHSLEGLDQYSHLWLIYHFHKNTTHPKAKVAPPRLGGERVGVFSTRSPHRPCPIGLSLVEIEKIEGATISFFGTDMVDGTPVMDIKPYIPVYDTPIQDEENTVRGPSENGDFYVSRQEPDGEESDSELYGAVGPSAPTIQHPPAAAPELVNTSGTTSGSGSSVNRNGVPNSVRVPNWIATKQKLKVCFNERAESQLKELDVQHQCIVSILEADPRSVYLRTKYGSQIFTFQLKEVTVTCKFDDKAGTVTVVQVRRNENVQDSTNTDAGDK